MFKKISMSLLVMVMALAAVAGGTFAWFTAESEPIFNEFTAGTVGIQADETVVPENFVFENWNPGDTVDKTFTIINTGTKNIFIRGIFEGNWMGKDASGEWVDWPEGDETIVTITPTGDTAANWVQLDDGYWYYKGYLDGSYDPQTGDVQQATFTVTVTLDGPGATNDYQGQRFVIETTFEAIQWSNGASDDVWGAAFANGTWSLVP